MDNSLGNRYRLAHHLGFKECEMVMKLHYMPVAIVLISFTAGAAMHIATSQAATTTVTMAGNKKVTTMQQSTPTPTPVPTPQAVPASHSPESPQTHAVTVEPAAGPGEPLAPAISPTPSATPRPSATPLPTNGRFNKEVSIVGVH